MNNLYVQLMAKGFEEELKKIANAEAKAGKSILGLLTRKEVALPVAGALAYKTLSTAEQDRRMGRQIRTQQGY